MAKKKHHYVPEFYLARFSCEGVKGGKIFSYSKKRHSLLETNTHDVCEKNKFYSILDSTSFDELALEDNFFADTVENYFSQALESIVGVVSKTKSEGAECGKFKISDNTKLTISLMLIIQFYRTPRFRKLYAGKNVILKGISKIDHKYKEVVVKDPVLVHAYNTFLNMSKLQELSNYLLNNKWILKYFDKDLLLTSDNPVVWYPEIDDETQRITVSNINQSRCFLFYPITSNIVLEIYDKDLPLHDDFNNLILKCEEEYAKVLNYFSCINADDIILLQTRDIDSYFPEIRIKVV